MFNLITEVTCVIFGVSFRLISVSGTRRANVGECSNQTLRNCFLAQRHNIFLCVPRCSTISYSLVRLA